MPTPLQQGTCRIPQGVRGNENLQSWALSVFFNFFNNKKWFCIFYLVNLTGSGLFKSDWCRNRFLTIYKMKKNHFLLLKIFKNTGSAQLWKLECCLAAFLLELFFAGDLAQRRSWKSCAKVRIPIVRSWARDYLDGAGRPFKNFNQHTQKHSIKRLLACTKVEIVPVPSPLSALPNWELGMCNLSWVYSGVELVDLLQSWALAVFFNFFTNEKWYLLHFLSS